MRRFSIVTVFQLGFLLFCTARTRIFKSHPLFHESWKNEFDLDLILLVALGCFVDFITDLDVHAKRKKEVVSVVTWGLKAKPALTFLIMWDVIKMQILGWELKICISNKFTEL